MTRQSAVQIARLSWIIPLGAMVANAVLGRYPGDTPQNAFQQGQAEGRACAVAIFYLVGAILAVVALRTVKQHGPANIRLPAWIGLALNLLLLLAIIGVVVLGMMRGG